MDEKKRTNILPTDQQKPKRPRMPTPIEVNTENDSSPESERLMATGNERFVTERTSLQRLPDDDCLNDSSREKPSTSVNNYDSFEANRTTLKGSNLIIGCSSFSKVLEKNYVFIDKSLFISAIISSKSRAVLILAPRRMGKSFNLGMLKEFFSTCDAYGKKRDPTEKFKGLKVMAPEVQKEVGEYMGNHPVVYLNLDQKTRFTCFADVENCFRNAVYQSHLDHLYILKKDDPELFERVEKRQEKWMLDTDLTTSLKTLTKRLRWYHKRECVFIVDGYDTILTHISKSIVTDTDSDEKKKWTILLQEATDFILGALDKAIKFNEDNVLFAILAGISDVVSEKESGPLNDVTRYRFLRNSQFFQFFGLLENEYDELIDKFKKDDSQLEIAKKLYNGYRFTHDDVNFRIYNPWAAFQFAKSPKNSPPLRAWCETGTIGVTANVCKHEKVRDDIFNLIRGKSLSFHPVHKITYEQLINLSIMCESLTLHAEVQIELYYTHLLNQGYLTIIATNGDIVTCELPNDEIKQDFCDFLLKHTAIKYGIDVTLFSPCAQLILGLLKLLEANDPDVTKFDKSLKQLHENLKNVYKINSSKTSVNEFVINSVSYFIGNEFTKNLKSIVGGQFYCDDGINKGYLDVSYVYGKNVIIIENKLNDRVEVAIQQILDRNYRSPYKDHKFILIGATLDYSRTKNFKIGYLVNSENVDGLKKFE